MTDWMLFLGYPIQHQSFVFNSLSSLWPEQTVVLPATCKLSTTHIYRCLLHSRSLPLPIAPPFHSPNTPHPQIHRIPKHTESRNTPYLQTHRIPKHTGSPHTRIQKHDMLRNTLRLGIRCVLAYDMFGVRCAWGYGVSGIRYVWALSWTSMSPSLIRVECSFVTRMSRQARGMTESTVSFVL